MKTVVRVVSLPDAHPRRERFRATAPGHVDWSFFDAATTLSTEDDIAYSKHGARIAQGRELTKGEIGCFVSHHRLWKMLLASDADRMLVLEDDVFVDWPALLPILDAAFPPGMDYVRLYAKRLAPARELGWFLGKRLIQFLHYVHGTQAYLLTREGAARLTRAARSIQRPVDDFMDRAWHHGVPSFALYPFPVIELALSSSIGGLERYQSPPLSAVDRMRRVHYRLTDKVQRVLYAAREKSPAAVVRPSELSGVIPHGTPQELQRRIRAAQSVGAPAGRSSAGTSDSSFEKSSSPSETKSRPARLTR